MCALPQRLSDLATTTTTSQQPEEQVSSVLHDLLEEEEQYGGGDAAAVHLHTPGWTTETQGSATPSAVQRTPQDAGWHMSVVGDATADDTAHASPLLSSGVINTSPAALLQTNALLEEVLFDLRYGQMAQVYDASTMGLFTGPTIDDDDELRTLLERNPARPTTVEECDSDEEPQEHILPGSAPPIVLGCGPLVRSPSQVSAVGTPRPQSWSASVQQAGDSDLSSSSSSSSTDSDLTAVRPLQRNNSLSESSSSSGSESSDESDSNADSGSSDSNQLQHPADRSSDMDIGSTDTADVHFETAHVRQITALVQHRVLRRGPSCLRRPSRTDTHASGSEDLSYDSGSDVQYEAARIAEVDSDEARQFLTSPASAHVDHDGDTRGTILSTARSPLETRPISRGVFVSPSQIIGAQGEGGESKPERSLTRRPSSISPWTSSAVRSARRATTANTAPLMPPPLVRGLRRSACSTFWSPSVRLSTARQTVPRVVIEEQPPKQEDEVHSTASPQLEVTKTPTDMPRFYTRPNFRVTIYPRTSDAFHDKSTHERIQSQLIATLSGIDVKHVQQQRTRWSALQRSGPLMSAAPPPVRPLPDVPGSATDGCVTMTTKRSSTTYTTTTYDSGTCSCCSMSSSTDTVVGHPITIGATATTIKRTSWQHDQTRDSWVSVTESETSYCSWVSYTSGSSISSSSSMPAAWRRRDGALLIAATDDATMQELVVQASPQSHDTLSPGPPSSCLMPPALLRVRDDSLHVPELPLLSPFHIDVHKFWPSSADDEEEHEPALVKWARHQRQSEAMRIRHEDNALASVARHLEDAASSASSDTVGPNEEQYDDDKDSEPDTGTCSCEDSPSTASSDDSARTLTPPRSEFHQLESPGLRLHHVVSPLEVTSDSSEEVDDVQKGQPPLLAALRGLPYGAAAQDVAPLRIKKSAPAPPPRRPAHQRWIMVDDEGKRIEGDRTSKGGSRDSSYSTGSSGGQSDRPRKRPESGSSMTESTLQDEEQLHSQRRKSQHRQSFVMSNDDSTQPILMSQSQCRAIVAEASMAGIGFDMCSSSVVAAAAADDAAAADRLPRTRTHPRSILKTASARWSESTGVRSSSSNSATMTSRTNSSSLSVHFNQPDAAAAVLARQASVTFALPSRSASMSEQSSVTARQSNMSSSETLISSLELDDQERRHVEPPPPQQRRQTTTPATPQSHDSSSSTSSRRLTSHDLAMRLQREELRRQRNDERLEALDKLEGKSRKSHLLSGLIKSSIAKGGGRGGVGLGLDGMADGGTDVERHAAYRANIQDDEDNIMPTTPLTPTRKELRQWEREWEMTHHVRQFSDDRAQRFTDVVGFDIGTVPFTQQARRKKAKKAAAAQAAAAGEKQQMYAHTSSSPDEIALHRQPSHTRKRLERELGAGLRKLSVAVEARHAARERYVDQ